MYYYEVSPSRIVRKGTNSYVYHHEDKLNIGTIVEINIGKQNLKSIVTAEASKPEFDTKKINRVLDNSTIPSQLLNACLWLADYYQNDYSALINLLIPRNLEQKRRKINQLSESTPKRHRTNIVFTKSQIDAIKKIDSIKEGSLILQGITGSGKTIVYFEAIQKVLESGRSALLLVPEISLTPQMISEANNYFKDVLIYNSSMTEAKKFNVWSKALQSSEPVFVIGTRSSLFLPIKDLGLIILDEAHDPSFIQDNTPRYSALRFSSALGQLHKSKVIFGSATPSVSELYLAKNSNRPIIYMESKAIADAKHPNIEIVDMRKLENKKNSIFSQQLIDAISKSLSEKKQILLYHNRRGNHGLTLCENCGWQAICPNCHIPFVLDSDNYSLNCRFCKISALVPKSCPSCNKASILHKIIGTKQVEKELNRIFPESKIVRFDSDNSKIDNLTSKYQDLYDGKIDIAIGTQILAKGLDLPNLNLVGIIQAENGLALPDYNSRERIFQLLYQVSGRVGRNSNKSSVIVQSYNPDQETILYAVNQDYKSFYKYEIKNRETGKFPPFVFILKLTCKYKTEKGAVQASYKMKEFINSLKKEVVVIGPMPAFYEKIRDNYRWQVIIKSKNRKVLQEIVSKINSPNWQIDLDANTLL